jgi:class 3 adenylate cyclase/HAMP domain-containing protein
MHNLTKNFFFSLRYKLILAILAITFFISLFLAYSSYQILKKKLFEEFLLNVETMTKLGAEIINKEELQYVVNEINNPKRTTTIEQLSMSKDVTSLGKELEFIRSSSPLVRYTYLLLPTKNPELAKQIIDSDYFSGSKTSPGFYADINISIWPEMQEALEKKMLTIEKNYTYDYIYKTYSVSGYAPIFNSKNEFLALLGIDMTNELAMGQLQAVTKLSILVAGAGLLISFCTAVFLGVIMTKGIIKLDRIINKFASKDFSVRSNIDSNDEIGRLGFSFNQMAETIQQFISASTRFVPRDLLKIMKKDSIIEVKLGDHILSNMTVLFADIRNFTKISEQMSVEDNFKFINSYLSCVSPIIRNHKGMIDKYLGDGIMALFPEHVDDSIDSAIAIHQSLKIYNQNKEQSIYPDVNVGIGIHYGPVMVGTVGEQERMDGTVISDTVNLASRIENLSKIYGSKIIVSEDILNLCSKKESYFTRYLDKVVVVGKIKPIRIFEICNADNESILSLKKQSHPNYQQGIDMFYKKEFKEAATHLKKVLEINPHDLPAKSFYEQACAFTNNPPPSDWDGTNILRMK